MLLDDGEEVTKEVGDSVANQKTIWDDTYQRKQNILVEINGVQNDFISSQAGMRSCILKVDEYALINKEDKGGKIFLLKEGMLCCMVTAENDRIVLWKASKLNWLEWKFV